jgi:superfamily II DNA/RNA helicase
MLDGGFDVLVATPGRVLAHHERGSLNLSNTAALLYDSCAGLAQLCLLHGAITSP